MANRLHAFFAWINGRNTALLISVLCIANFIGYQPEGGEEQYFAFAKQFMDPAWMPNSFALNHPAGGNLAFQVIIGFLLRFLTFEQMAFWGRLVNFVLYAIPLALVFRKLRISNIEILFLLQVVFFSHQALYAGEWIFKNLEEKTLAYIFIFWSLYFLLDDKPLASSVFAAIATYFHFLVGGWFFGFVILFFLFYRRKIMPVLYSVIVYGVITLPFILYLFKTYFINNPAVIDGIDTNAVYAFWRLKHHIGIVHDARYFFTYPFGGVMITLFLFLLCIFKFRKINDPVIKKLNLLNVIIFAQQFISLILAVFDKHGVFVKTYPFRTNSISLFLFLTELTLVLKYYEGSEWYRKLASGKLRNRSGRKYIFSDSLNSLLVLIFLAVFIPETVSTVRNFDKLVDLDTDMLSLIGFVKQNTPGSSVFIFPDGDRPLSFIRRAERERFVVEKFTPTKSATICEWYKRAIIKRRLKKDITLIDSVKQVYQVNYLVTDSVYEYPSLVPEKQFGKHRLYRITQ